MCYKDGPQLPSLNFTTTCTEYGRYVIFYNERQDGITYPEEYEEFNVFSELCEVAVLGKTSLFFGFLIYNLTLFFYLYKISAIDF